MLGARLPRAPRLLAARTHLRCMSAAIGRIRYRSTCGGQLGFTFSEAVLQGLGTDRGLLVPERIPTFSLDKLESWRGASFEELAFEMMSLYLSPDDVPPPALRDIINRSYATFRDPRVTPVEPLVDGLHVLELYHGPTFAFKDVALQFLGNLFEHLLEQRGGATITVIGATSGDTGSSAIQGLRGKKGIECFIMYPEGRTSSIQEKQMITVLDPNIHNIALGGTFDDCQYVVKALFADEPFRTSHSLAAVNSINWARILAQTVYYVYAYLQVTSAPSGAAREYAPKVSFSVPTGNFGDILAGWYAKSMGLPVDQLIVATNENDILHRFWSQGDYSRSQVKQTLSPSMDIQISSNFERFLFHMGGDDPKSLAELMRGFESGNPLSPSDSLLAACRTQMVSQRVADGDVLQTIADVRAKTSDEYTLDPHSAVGVAAARQFLSEQPTPSSSPMVCLACAHWSKFSDAVGAAIGPECIATMALPEPLASLEKLETRVKLLPNSVGTVKDFITDTVASRRG